jgi:streptogramin lyase
MRRGNWYFDALASFAAVAAALLAGCTKGESKVDDLTAETESHLVAPPVTQFVVLARHGAQFGDRVFVMDGAVGVAPSSNATPNALTTGRDARIAVGKTSLAQRITLGEGAGIGDVGADRIDAPSSATTGMRAPYVAPPAAPDTGTFTAGTAAVTVGSGETRSLAPGKFAAITVNGGTLNLQGGLYEIQSLRLTNDARMVALTPSTVRVTGGITALDRAFILANAPLGAKDLRLVVAGTVDSNNTAITWGIDCQMTAFVIAKGIFRAGARFIASGAVTAQDVILGVDSRLTFETGFACGSPASCDDNNPCTLDACVDAQCTHVNATNGTACNDGNACTRTDTCQAGVCTGANPVVCTASDQCHDVGTCSPATGTCSSPAKSNGTACNDGNACTRTDTCQAGVCTGANPVVCTASDQCHDVGTCSPATGTCSNPAKSNGTVCNDSNACTRTDTCQTGVCTGANPVVCTASDQCHDVGTCNPTSGTCSNPIKANGTTCNDGNACTRSDTCQTGTCVGVNPVVCAASDQCHDVGTCNPSSGTCSDPAKPNGTACNDGSACTRTDQCQAGICTGTNPVVCTASDQCHDSGTCDPASGTCSNPSKPDGTTCSDGNACTRTDTCHAGTCEGGNPVVCTASDQCHDVGTCDGASGTCSNPSKPDGTTCSDGNACTRTDICQGGACTGTSPVVCTASDQCHGVGICDPASGTCSNPSQPDGTPCDDGNACSMGDSCRAGVCNAGSSLRITEFATGLRQPTAIISGPDGALWFVSPETRLLGDDGSVGRFDPMSGSLTTFFARRFLGDIITGPDGNLWVRDGLPIPDGRLPSIGRLTTAGFFLDEFAGIETRALAATPDGNVWFTGAGTMGSAVGRITAQGAQLTPYIYGSTITRAITAGPDGNMWITESNDGVGQAFVAKITLAGTITEFPVTSNGNLNDIVTGPDGHLWFTDGGRNEIGRITVGGAITKFAIPTPASVPFGIAVGPDGNIWFTERLAGQIGRITPDGVVTEICIPTAASGPSSIAAGTDGNMWFTEFNSGNLGRVQL